MLVLSRKTDQAVVVDGDIEIRVLDVSAKEVRLGFTAPQEVEILREELLAHEETQPDPV